MLTFLRASACLCFSSRASAVRTLFFFCCCLLAILGFTGLVLSLEVMSTVKATLEGYFFLEQPALSFCFSSHLMCVFSISLTAKSFPSWLVSALKLFETRRAVARISFGDIRCIVTSAVPWASALCCSRVSTFWASFLAASCLS